MLALHCTAVVLLTRQGWSHAREPCLRAVNGVKAVRLEQTAEAILSSGQQQQLVDQIRSPCLSSWETLQQSIRFNGHICFQYY
jgi:hypothetical protein